MHRREKKPYFDAEIASADDVLNLSGNKHRFEFWRQIRRSMWYMEIPQCQNQHHFPIKIWRFP